MAPPLPAAGPASAWRTVCGRIGAGNNSTFAIELLEQSGTEELPDAIHFVTDGAEAGSERWWRVGSRTPLGEESYRRENETFREARGASCLRYAIAQVTLEALEALCGRIPQTNCPRGRVCGTP